MAARPPPALMDDVIIEILLRLPPDDIACLSRASLVCKPWRRLLSDRAFFRRYREIHGAPPVLGFLYNNYRAGSPLFVPTTPASPLPQSAFAGRPASYCRVLDCRHGRVLVYHPGKPSSLTVWDPVTSNKQWCFRAPVHLDTKFTAAVLCASNGCDHLDCSSGPFLVVLLQRTYREPDVPLPHPVNFFQTQDLQMAQASLYSSGTCTWTVSASINFNFSADSGQSLLAGNILFFMIGVGEILKYDLIRGALSVIHTPLEQRAMWILCCAEDGGLGITAVEGCTLRLWFWRTNPNGVSEWARGRDIDLSNVATGVPDQSTKFYVAGFAEGTGYIFIRSIDHSIFSVELKSGRISKITSGMFGSIFPLTGFYIPDLASTRLQLQ